MNEAREKQHANWFGAYIKNAFNKFNDEQQDQVQAWLNDLKAIRSRKSDSAAEKAKAAVKAAQEHKAVWPLAKAAVSDLKRMGWDDRKWSARVGLSDIVHTFFLFGAAGAGLAAFKGAIPLSLWIVAGAGGEILNTLIKELGTRKERLAEVRASRRASLGPR